MKMGNSRALLGCLCAFSTLVQGATTLDLTDAGAIQSAAAKALANLLTYYTPNAGGVFSQVQTPWHESGMIFAAFQDYLKYTGDNQFSNLVNNALLNISFGTTQDFLNGQQSEIEGLSGKWNDDILWPSMAIIGGGENYGYASGMPGAGGDWLVVPEKTAQQTYSQWDDECNGGIYWSRNRDDATRGTYKSTITQLEWMANGARINVATKNQTYISISDTMLSWMQNNGIMTDTQIYDGVDTKNCLSIQGSQWSYNYGQLIGALAWLHQATGDQKYLDLASPYLATAISTFQTGGVITEQCEVAGNCNRDQQGFKAILVRNMAYLYRATNNQNDQNSIKTILGATIGAMARNSCDANWNCGGNWTTDTAPVLYVRSQYVSSALLVSALGVFTEGTGEGLLPANLNPGTLGTTFTNPTGNGTDTSGCVTKGAVTSCPLSAANRSVLSRKAGLAVGLLAWTISLCT